MDTYMDVAIEAAGGNGASLLHVPEKGSAVLGGGAGGPGEAGRAEKMGGGGGAGVDGGESPPPPPRALMAFPPVARLLNLLLTSFNQLREVREGILFLLLFFLVVCF